MERGKRESQRAIPDTVNEVPVGFFKNGCIKTKVKLIRLIFKQTALSLPLYL